MMGGSDSDAKSRLLQVASEADPQRVASQIIMDNLGLPKTLHLRDVVQGGVSLLTSITEGLKGEEPELFLYNRSELADNSDL